MTASPENPGPMLELVKADFREVARIINDSGLVYLSAPDRVAMPFSATVEVYILTNVATAGSTGVDYHTIVSRRSGQPEGQVSIDTRNAEMKAYSAYYCGTLKVGRGDIISYTLTVTGAPAPTLTASNLTILCALTPIEATK